MTCANDPTESSSARSPHRRTSSVLAASVFVAVGMVAIAACSGGSDGGSATTTAPGLAVTLPSTTTVPATTTTAVPATTTTIALVTEGAVVAVANASGVNGGAGRLSDRLGLAGFTMTDPTNASDSVGQLTTTQVYYATGDEAALAVAQSVRLALGGGSIEVIEVGTPAPTQSGELGSATVLVVMGNDVVDVPLAELQGIVPPATTEPTDSETTDTEPTDTEPTDTEPTDTEPTDTGG